MSWHFNGTSRRGRNIDAFSEDYSSCFKAMVRAKGSSRARPKPSHLLSFESPPAQRMIVAPLIVIHVPCLIALAPELPSRFDAAKEAPLRADEDRFGSHQRAVAVRDEEHPQLASPKAIIPALSSSLHRSTLTHTARLLSWPNGTRARTRTAVADLKHADSAICARAILLARAR